MSSVDQSTHLPACAFIRRLAVLALVFFANQSVLQAPQPKMKPIRPSEGSERIRRLVRGIEAGGARIEIDAPWQVQPDVDLKLDVWFEQTTPSVGRDLAVGSTVYFEQTDKIAYEPRVVDLVPGIRKTIHFRVQKTKSGLAEIIATAAGREDLSLTLDAGANLVPRIAFDGQLEAFSPSVVTVDVVDASGGGVPLDAPLSLVLQASNAQLQVAEESWQADVEIPLKRGSTSSPLIRIRSQSWSPTAAALKAELRMNTTHVLATGSKVISVVPSWWVSLSMSVLGGLCYGLYRLISETSAKSRRRLRSVAAGDFVAASAAGAIAYLLASWDVLGIKVDTTSVRGFLLVGFLFAYVGVDALLKRLIAPKEDAL